MSELSLSERLEIVAAKLAENSAAKTVVLDEYETKKKAKALTDSERLDRIEKILGIQ